jgi:hypothetical protein
MRSGLDGLRANTARFFRDTRGQIAFLSIVGVIPLSFLLFSIVNSGTAIQDATRTQDAADMIALVHAAEGARSMNTLAMNHVSLAQNYTTAVHASSLDNMIIIHQAVLGGAIIEAGIYAAETCQRYANVPIIGGALVAICAAPSVAYAGDLGLELDRVIGIRNEFDPDGALEIASDALNALDEQNREILDRFPEAVSEQASQIAEVHNVTDIYFDESCARGIAASCDDGDRRQGMELPVTVNEPRAVYLHFCAALFQGTGGLSSAGLPMLGNIPGMSSFEGVPLMNGSFQRRGFPINEGPMRGGDANGDRYLPIHVSKTSDIGYALSDYQDMAQDIRLYDGVLNAFATPAELISFSARLATRILLGRSTDRMQRDAERRARDAFNNIIIGGTSTDRYMRGPGIAYPTDQTPDSNLFTQMVETRVAAQCVGAVGRGSVGSGLVDFLAPVTGILGFSTVPDFDLYHPVRAAGSNAVLPVVMPDLEDFDDDYRPLAFVYRERGSRWSPVVFEEPNEGFVRYGQAITYNPDEISMYSQNWRARLIPADRMEDLEDVLQRMERDAPPAFDEFRSDLETVAGAADWNELVTR